MRYKVEYTNPEGERVLAIETCGTNSRSEARRLLAMIAHNQGWTEVEMWDYRGSLEEDFAIMTRANEMEARTGNLPEDRVAEIEITDHDDANAGEPKTSASSLGSIKMQQQGSSSEPFRVKLLPGDAAEKAKSEGPKTRKSHRKSTKSSDEAGE
jgi:hypothetical protein